MSDRRGSEDRAALGRFRLYLSLLSVAGLISLVGLPVETLVGGELPAPIWAVRLLILIQPAVLLAGALLLGFWLTPKLGLDAPAIRATAERRPVLPILLRQIGPAVLAALIVAAILILYQNLVMPRLAGGEFEGLADFAPPAYTRLLYGGIAEEVLTRWGLVSLFAFICLKLTRRAGPPGRAVLSSAVLIAALLFALGHLPILLGMTGAPPAWLVATVIAGNLVPGLLFGWLFVSRGLEAAMMAHAGAHALAMIGGA